LQPWLRAGLIGAAILATFALVGLIPVIGPFCCLAWPFVYIGVGALAAHYVPPTREAGRGAAQGALAAMLATFAGGLVSAVISAIQAASVTSTQVLSLLPPGLLEQYRAAGGDPALLDKFVGPGGTFLGGSLCCGFGILLAAIMGAIGGAILAGAKPD
jgi:hypothetical protein